MPALTICRGLAATTTKRGGEVSYLKDLPCAGCGTESTYYFPDKPTAHYCYCEFRFEIGEQIAREIGELPEYTETEAYKRAAFYLDRDDVMNAIARGENRAG